MPSVSPDSRPSLHTSISQSHIHPFPVSCTLTSHPNSHSSSPRLHHLHPQALCSPVFSGLGYLTVSPFPLRTLLRVNSDSSPPFLLLSVSVTYYCSANKILEETWKPWCGLAWSGPFLPGPRLASYLTLNPGSPALEGLSAVTPVLTTPVVSVFHLVTPTL